MGALAALWFPAERCVLFYHPGADAGEAAVTVLLKPEPGSDLFVDLWGVSHNNDRFYFLYLFTP